MGQSCAKGIKDPSEVIKTKLSGVPSLKDRPDLNLSDVSRSSSNESERSEGNASQSSLIFSRNEVGAKFLKTSLRSLEPRLLFPDDEKENSLVITEASTGLSSGSSGRGGMEVSNRDSIPFGMSIEEVYEGVEDGPVLGTGITGEVREIINRETGKKFALKKLNTARIRSEQKVQQLLEEIEIMCQLDHPNIIKLEEVYDSDEYIYLVMEMCRGRDLFDRLVEQPEKCFSEESAAILINQIVSSVQYIHAQGIAHRDMKLENFLFTEADSENSEPQLKMIDFGLSRHMKQGEKRQDAVGTPYTVAPEVIKGSYTEICDIWGIGVIAYLLLSGRPPFGGCSNEPMNEVGEKILNGHYKFEPLEIWDNVSKEAKDFISSLLEVDPANRPTSRQLMRNPWLQRYRKSQGDDETFEGCWLLKRKPVDNQQKLNLFL